MSTYTGNVQTSIAQAHLVSKESEKNKNISHKHQEKIGEKIKSQLLEENEKIAALHRDVNTDKIEKRSNKEEKYLNSNSGEKKEKDKEREEIEIVRDSQKGKTINIKC